jgi:hypothetical protein
MNSAGMAIPGLGPTPCEVPDGLVQRVKSPIDSYGIALFCFDALVVQLALYPSQAILNL